MRESRHMDGANERARREAPPLLLHIGPDPALGQLVVGPGLGVVLVHAADLVAAQDILADERLACIVVELSPSEPFTSEVEALSGAAPDVAILAVADDPDEALALAAVRSGAQDVIATRWLKDGARLRQTIRFAVERHRLVQRRAHAELRYRTAFQHAPIGMAVADLDGRILRVNPALCGLVGRSAEVLRSMYLADLAEEDDGAILVGPALLAVAGSDTGFSTELRYRAADGRPGWGRLKASLIRDGSGRPLQIVGQLEDVTAFRTAEAQLSELVQAKERKLRHEIALAKCSAVLLMSEGPSDEQLALEALLEAVDASSLFIGVNVDDPHLGPCSQLVHVVSVPGTQVDVEYWSMMPWARMPTSHAALSQGKPYVLEYDRLSPEEAAVYAPFPRSAEVDVPIFTDGEWAGLIGFSDDDPDRCWLEDEVRLLQTAAEMLGSFWERRDARRRLEATLRSKDELVAAVSHELRTPLTAVVALAHELVERPDDFSAEEQREFLGLIASQSSEVADIVEDLLVAARVDMDRIAVRPRAICLRDEVERVVAGLQPPPVFPVDVVGPDTPAWADPIRTRQVVRNLVSNAARHGGEQIRVEVEPAGPIATLRVIDDGPGISADRHSLIFEPYQRDHDPGSQPASVGLGLTISRKLSLLMGGDLSYRRAANESVFELSLPTREIRQG